MEIQTTMEKTLGFNTTQMAKFIGVPRVVYYKHRNGGRASNSDTNSYMRAQNLVNQIKDSYPSALHGIKRINVEGKTLQSWLTCGQWEEQHILSVVAKINEMVGDTDVSNVTTLSIEEQRKRVFRTSKHS